MDMLPVDIIADARSVEGHVSAATAATSQRASSIMPDDAAVSVVTGGTDGIGRAVALQLARVGHRVIIIGRNPSRGAEVVAEMRGATPSHQLGKSFHFFEADLSSMAQTAAVAARVTALTSRVDALICCAGAFTVKPEWTSEGLERSFALNYLSRFLLVRRLLPHLSHAPSGRVVLVANAGRYRDTLDLGELRRGRSRGGLRLAGATQFANDILTVELAARCRTSALEITCVYPGIARTDLFGHAPGLPSLLAGGLARIAARVGLPADVAACTPASLAADPAACGVSGRFFGPRMTPTSVPSRILREDRRAEIWAASEALLSEALLSEAVANG
jgi:NAD(P)-dependent dehydrogenase (short-subunit alcohol dehydrogenase family)